ncbi:MAG: hypothetical protein HC869_07165 [Rhodospirillales bacterium]|nr:hypothetical protein [Rhodospirillales bacterium]
MGCSARIRSIILILALIAGISGSHALAQVAPQLQASDLEEIIHSAKKAGQAAATAHLGTHPNDLPGAMRVAADVAGSALILGVEIRGVPFDSRTHKLRLVIDDTVHRIASSPDVTSAETTSARRHGYIAAAQALAKRASEQVERHGGSSGDRMDAATNAALQSLAATALGRFSAPEAYDWAGVALVDVLKRLGHSPSDPALYLARQAKAMEMAGATDQLISRLAGHAAKALGASPEVSAIAAASALEGFGATWEDFMEVAQPGLYDDAIGLEPEVPATDGDLMRIVAIAEQLIRLSPKSNADEGACIDCEAARPVLGAVSSLLEYLEHSRMWRERALSAYHADARQKYENLNLAAERIEHVEKVLTLQTYLITVSELANAAASVRDSVDSTIEHFYVKYPGAPLTEAHLGELVGLLNDADEVLAKLISAGEIALQTVGIDAKLTNVPPEVRQWKGRIQEAIVAANRVREEWKWLQKAAQAGKFRDAASVFRRGKAHYNLSQILQSVLAEYAYRDMQERKEFLQSLLGDLDAELVTVLEAHLVAQRLDDRFRALSEAEAKLAKAADALRSAIDRQCGAVSETANVEIPTFIDLKGEQLATVYQWGRALRFIDGRIAASRAVLEVRAARYLGSLSNDPMAVCSDNSTFAIIAAEYPSLIQSGSDRHDLVVTYAGNPVPPITLTLRPRSCPAIYTCVTEGVIITPEAGSKRLVAADSIWCSGIIGAPWELDYEVFLQDANGLETPAVPVQASCQPQN